MAEQKEQYNQYIYEIKCTNGEVFASDPERYSSLLSDNENLDWKLTVNDMQYVKEIYKPCWLKLSLHVANKEVNHANTASIGGLYEYFNKASLTVKVKRDSDETKIETTIVKNYYVMTVEPIQKPNATFSLVLTAYSADYKISLGKYSECYLNLPLNDLIKNNLGDLNKAIKTKDANHTNIEFKCDTQNGLQVINYSCDGGKEYKVYHTPYAVQYDESFYAFIARLANRYGEFLFFEDGSLHLGVDPDLIGHTHTITNVSDKPQFNNFSRAFQAGSALEENISGTHYDYLNSEAKKEESSYYNDIYEADDMNISLCLKNENLSSKENGWRDYMDWVGLSQKCVTFLTAVRCEDGIGDHFVAAEVTNVAGAFTKLGLAWMDAIFKAKSKVDKTDKKYTDAVDALIKAAGEYEKEQMQGNTIRPFASFNTNEYVLEQNKAEKKRKYDEKSKAFEKLQSDLNKNQLGEAEKSFKDVKKLSKELADKLATLAKKAETRKEDLTKVQDLADCFNMAANGTSSSGRTCLDEIQKADKAFNGAIETSKTNKTASGGSDVEKKIDAAKAALDEFKKCFNTTPSFSELSALTDFCNVPQKVLKDGELTEQERKNMVSEIQGIYKKLKEEALQAVSEALDSTKNDLNSILEAASQIADAEQEKNAAEAEYLMLYMKLVKSNLFHKALTSVQQSETQIDRNRVKIEINTYNYKEMPLLGETLSFNGATYLIIKVDSAVTIADGSSTFAETLKLELIPTAKKGSGSGSNDGTAVEDNLWIPPMSDCRQMKKVGAMVAEVSDNKDPLAMGRLRVKYKWQGKKSCKSPWIRMATPYTSKYGAGMHFVPSKGDEVLVDFYNGNIDRPIVVGVLRNDTHDKDYTTGWSGRTDLTNGCGQQLGFSDDDMAFTDAVKFFPGVGSILGAFYPNAKDSINVIQNLAKGGKDNDNRNNDFQKYMRGGISLTDKFGTWEISGSTTSRGVTISSRLGNISIDALTGISISAPLGDVSIAAKNISLQASNNISIESGTQVKRQRKIKKTFKDGIGTGILDTVKGVAKTKFSLIKIDLSLVRLMTEAVVPPIEGTLLLKSNRYLKLEAGKDGNAEDSDQASVLRVGKYGSFKSWKASKLPFTFDIQEFIYTHKKELKALNDGLNAIPAKVKTICDNKKHLLNEAAQAWADLCNFSLNDVNTEDILKELTDSLWDKINEKTENDINQLTSTKLTDLIKKVTNLDTTEKIRKAFKPTATGDDLNALITGLAIGVKADATDKNKQTLVYIAKKKKFLLLARDAADKAAKAYLGGNQQKEAFANKNAGDLATAILGTDASGLARNELKTYKINDDHSGTDEIIISKADLEDVFKPLLGEVYATQERHFGDDAIIKSFTRICLLKAIKKTGSYVYDKFYAQEKLDIEKRFKNLNLPESDYIEKAVIQGYDYFTIGGPEDVAKKGDYWNKFVKSCKFLTDAWQHPAKQPTVGGVVASTVADVLGGTGILDEGISVGSVRESYHIKSSGFGGRVLISDHDGVTVGFDGNGQTQVTTIDYGSKEWK